MSRDEALSLGQRTTHLGEVNFNFNNVQQVPYLPSER